MSAGGGGDVRKERGGAVFKEGGSGGLGEGASRVGRLVAMADTATAIPCGKRRGARRAVGWAFGPVGARAVFLISSAENNT